MPSHCVHSLWLWVRESPRFHLGVLWCLRGTHIDMLGLMIKIIVLRSIFHLLLKHCICLGQILLKNTSKLADDYFVANKRIFNCGTLVSLISLHQSWIHTSEVWWVPGREISQMKYFRQNIEVSATFVQMHSLKSCIRHCRNHTDHTILDIGNLIS